MTLLPPFYLDALVALGQSGDDNAFSTFATGFFLGFNLGSTNDAGQPFYATYLVTNKHVLADRTAPLMAKLNAGAGSAFAPIGLVDDAGNSMWAIHDRYDVAVTPMNVPLLRDEHGADVTFIPNEILLTSSQMQEMGIGTGDDVFVLGFPMGLTGSTRNYGIARAGILARFDNDVLAEQNSYIIDSSVFPGNSGGPVVVRPSALTLPGRRAPTMASLVGLVSSYLPYTDVAISTQTNRPRVIFEENSGLASVVPMEAVQELVAPQLAAAADSADLEITTKEDAGQLEADSSEPA